MNDQKKGNFSSTSPDQEMDIGECSSDGEDKGEGDDEEEDDEMEEEIESEDDIGSVEEVVDEEDDTRDSSVSSTNFNNINPDAGISTTVCESSPNYAETEFHVCEDSNNQKPSDENEKDQSCETVVCLEPEYASSTADVRKLAVKLKRCKSGVYSCNKNTSNGVGDADQDDRVQLHPEKWRGKVCSLCNLGERSQLGQGAFIRVKKPDAMENIEKTCETSIAAEESVKLSGTSTAKNKKCNKITLSLFEPVDELGIVGYSDKVNISDLFDEEGYIYIHQYCALFSCDITRDSSNELENVIPAVVENLSRICSYCNRYGASVACSFNNCEKFFHFPCSAASAGFIHLKNTMYFCNSHVNHVSLLAPFNEVSCRKCYILGNVSNLIMCSTCGNYYHGGCVGLASLPGNRTGWQCQDCRSCQVCRSTDEAAKEVTCETCQKMYHATCLRPVLTSIPKFGWKCKCCRKCNDCGSRTPGSGFSSRWHCHFTVCDSCYQQRNKGFSCPLCHRAYRAGSSKEMAQCSSCTKFVHRTCDPEADPFTYRKKSETLPDYQYVCPMCKNMSQLTRLSVKRKDSFDESTTDLSMSASQESLNSEDMDIDFADKEEFKYSGGFGLGKGKPLTARKKMQLSSAKRFRSKNAGKATTNGSAYQKRNQKITEFGRKRCTKSKIRGVFGIPGLGLQRPSADSQNKSDSDNSERKIILCSNSDKFALTQDVCAMCGALGTDQEGCLISCVQCGQCYHPYCVDVKVTKAILQKGWRCLDCMICEVCGKKDDDPILILCDDCNMSYHITCVGLLGVPEGPWKCKWCAQCLTCGANDPGVNCSWSENYTECGPCSSRLTCPSCNVPYIDGDHIIKCDCCERWLHGLCDQMKTEQDAEKCAEEGYTCLLCRPKDTPPPHLVLPPLMNPVCCVPKLKIKPLSPVKVPEHAVKEEAEHLVDGTYLRGSGVNQMTNLLSAIDMNVFTLRKKSKRGASAISDQGPVQQQQQQRKGIRKIGVGGFDARNRNVKCKDKTEHEEAAEKESLEEKASSSVADEKPRKKKTPRKPKSKFAECYPSYIQNAFFGRQLLDTSKDELKNLASSDSESNEYSTIRRITNSEMVTLSEDELKVMEIANAKREELEEELRKKRQLEVKLEVTIKNENEEEQEKQVADNDNGSFKDILNMSENLLDSIMNEGDSSIKTNRSIIDDSSAADESDVNTSVSDNQKDEFSDILGPNFSLESMVNETALPNMDSKDVEEIFKGVVSTDEPHPVMPTTPNNPIPKYTPLHHSTPTIPVGNQQQGVIMTQGPTPAITSPSHPVMQGNMGVITTRNPAGQSAMLPSQQNTPSPVTYLSVSPYHSEYSTSPSQFSPACSEPPSPWIQEDSSTMDSVGTPAAPTASSSNQKNPKKMEEDEALGENATMSLILFGNLKHPELKTEYPVWSDRHKQIAKKWKVMTNEQRRPFLDLAKVNREKLRGRGRNVQQMSSKDENSCSDLMAANSVQDLVESPKAAAMILSESPESMSKVCQEDNIFQPLLSAVLSGDNGVALNSNDHSDSAQSGGMSLASNDSPAVVVPSSVPRTERLLVNTTMSQNICPAVTVLNSSPAVTHKTVTTTIPSHPSTIQYIPIIQTPITQADSAPVNVRTVHLIPTTVASSQSNLTAVCSAENVGRPSTIHYQYVPTVHHQNRNTIHYPPSNIQIIHSGGSSLIMSSNSLITAALQNVTAAAANAVAEANSSASNNFLQLMPSASCATAGQNAAVVRNIQVMSLPASEEQTESTTTVTTSTAATVSLDTISDHNIRVLTPSEIMKTLPSLGQESFDGTSKTEQERIPSALPKVRESEEEKQWKQKQARRQQQVTSQQQQIIDSRLQNQQRMLQQSRPTGVDVVDNPAATLYATSTSADTKPMQLQTSPTQEANLVSPTPLTSPGRPQQRSPFPSPAFRLPANQSASYQRVVQKNEVFTPPGAPRRPFFVAPPSQSPQLQINNQSLRQAVTNPELNRQLCELIQRQQPQQQQQSPQQPISPDQQNTTQTRIWVQDASGQQQQQQVSADPSANQDPMAVSNATNLPMQVFEGGHNMTLAPQPFRPPLPPTGMRPQQQQQQRLAQQHMFIQQRIPQPFDAARLRLLIHEQHRQQQMQQQRHPMHAQHQQLLKFQQQQQLQQQQQPHAQPQVIQTQQQSPQSVHISRPPFRQILTQSPSVSQATPPSPAPVQNASQLSYSEQAQNILNGTALKEEFPQYAQRMENEAGKNGTSQHQNDRVDTQNEGIPESVTADLDALEREDVPGTMSEMSALFGDLNEDELFAEMAGFDILKYTDPELDNLTSGDKTNILYDLVNSSSSDPTKAKHEEESSKAEAKPSAPSGAAPGTIIKLEKKTADERPPMQKNVPPGMNENMNLQKSNPQAPHQQQQQQIASHVVSVNSIDPQMIPRSQPSPAAMGLPGMPMTPRPAPSGTPGTPATTPTELSGSNDVTPPPPPPPPPYPGPPPPYPSQLKQQQPQMVRTPSPNVVGVSPPGQPVTKLLPYNTQTIAAATMAKMQQQRRSLLLQEQPLLLEDLVEQEKREQDKQTTHNLNTALPPLSDAEFERLKADVLNSTVGIGGSPKTLMAPQDGQAVVQNALLQPNATPQAAVAQQQQQIWHQSSSSPRPENPDQRVPVYKARTLPVPPEPPETIVTEQDRHTQQVYERWMVEQSMIVEDQKKYYEGEVGKLRKNRKNIKSKQRGLEKHGNKLTEQEDQELQRLSADISSLQKLCDSSRKSSKQHAALVQEYKNKNPNFNCPPFAENVSATAYPTSNTPAVAAVPGGPQQLQQPKIYSSVSTLPNKSQTNTILSQHVKQSEEMFPGGGDAPRHMQPQQLRTPAGVKPPQQIIRYSNNGQLRFVQTVRQKSGEVLAFQVPADNATGHVGSILYQGLRHPLKTQPLIVSTVATPGSPSNFVTTGNVANTYTVMQGQEKDRIQTLQQLTPEQQRMVLQKQQQLVHQAQQQQAAALAQQTLDPNLVVQRQRRMVTVQRPAMPQQQQQQLQGNGNIATRIPHFAQSPSPHSYQMLPSPSSFNQPPGSPMAVPVQSPRPGPPPQFAHPSNSPVSVPPQSPQPASPLAVMTSPRHVSQFVHPNSPVPPPHSPIYQQQYVVAGHAASPIPPQSPVLIRRPPSVENFVQDSQQAEIKDTYNSSANNSRSGGGGGFVNNIPIPEAFVRLGIKPGLLGGSPTWKGESPKNEPKNTEEREGNPFPSVSIRVTATATCSRPSLVDYEVDQDSNDSALFTNTYSPPSKLVLKQESPTDFEVDATDSCPTTPKNEDAGVEVHVYKDVPLVNGCKSEENSLGMEDFAPHISDEDDEEIPLVLDSDGLHLTLDPSSDLLVLNVSEDHDDIMDDTSEIGSILYMDDNKQESLIITEIKSEEAESEVEDPSTNEELEIQEHTEEELEEKKEEDSVQEVVQCKVELPDEEESAVDDPVLIEENDAKEEESVQEDEEHEVRMSVSPPPAITSSVRQMTLPTLETAPSTMNAAAHVTYSNNNKLPVYIENFHSYVKKVPTSEESVVVMEEEEEDVSAADEPSPPLKAEEKEEDAKSEENTQKLEKTISHIKTENEVQAVKEQEETKLPEQEQEQQQTEEAPSVEIENIKNETSPPPPPSPLPAIAETLPSNLTNADEEKSKEEEIVAEKPAGSPAPPLPPPLPTPPPQTIKKADEPSIQAVPTNSAVCPPRVRPSDDTQNVLLKQLLQNSGCSSTITHSTMTQHVTKPLLQSPTYRSPSVTALVEAAVTPTAPVVSEAVVVAASNSDVSVLKMKDTSPEKEITEIALPVPQIVPEPAAEPLVPNQPPAPVSTPISTPTPTTAATSEAQLTSSTTTVIAIAITTSSSVIKQATVTVTAPVEIKKEITTTSAPPTSSIPVVSSGMPVPSASNMSPIHIDIKKEPAPDELISPLPRTVDAGDTPNSVSGDSSSGSVLDPQELKKLKRRQYQAKRRQSQGKDHSSGIPKKRARKASKIEEDYSYDTFVDTLMAKLRQLPPLPITEPLLTHNYAVCLPFGAEDPTKITCKSWINGELVGTYGNFVLTGQDDHYNTDPLGDEEPLPPSAVPPTTRGFYNAEFPPLSLEADYEERRLDLARLDRELDTPDSIVSSSSPECIMPHTPARFAGLRLIDENGSGPDSEDDERLSKRVSPIIPLVAPLALKPRAHYYMDFDKENYGKYSSCPIKSRHSPHAPLKDSGNVSVTLTLNSEAAQNIVGVLKNLATVLNISPPAAYKIIDRVSSPNKVNPFGNRVEEVELEKYFDGLTKVCSFCEVQISPNKSVRKKVSEVPFVVQDGVSEDLLFCSYSCYLQMLLLVPPIVAKEKDPDLNENILEPSPCKKMKLEKSRDESKSMETGQGLDSTDGHSVEDLTNESNKMSTSESSVKVGQPASEKKPVRGVKFRTWSSNSVPPPVQKYKKPTEKEITETLFRMGITVTPKKMPEDMRNCIFCHQVGDSVADGPSRLLNYDVDKWAHLNCSLWSDGVYETVSGALVNVDTALQQGMNVVCTYCSRPGATLKCFKLRCSSVYHLSCAVKHECVFYKNKTFYCNAHIPKSEKENELTTLAVYRRVYVDRDEDRQVASIVQHAELTHLMRIGSLMFVNVGQLLPHQLEGFHTSKYIYPIGYKVIRFYWSMRMFNKRCQYVCSIHEMAGRPEFRILVQEPGEDDIEFRDATPKAVWARILEPLEMIRRTHDSVQLFPSYVTGEDLFGLEEPAIVRILESLPGIESLSDYRMKYGKNPLLELPLAVNPSGCARCEPRVRGPPVKRAYTQRTSSVMPRPVLTSSPLFSGDLSCPYSKHFVHSKSSQYKKMKQEWRNYVYLARSKIQGLGLYAARDIDKHTMVIEYIGEIIRSQLSDFREKQYEAKNRGVYMFRLDDNRVVDATVCGGLARYINHSCNPNCITEKVEVDREYRIIIFSKRKITRGEELSYDYQFDIEDDSQKIPCMCGAPNCRKWMN